MTATDKQLSYLRSLIKGRFADLGEAMVEYGLSLPTPSNLTSYDASGMIEWLKAAARPPVAAEAFEKAQSDRALFDRAMAGDAEARAELGW